MTSQDKNNQIIIQNYVQKKIKNMNKNKNSENNLAFIDGQNLYLGTRSEKPAWVVDLARFRVYLL